MAPSRAGTQPPTTSRVHLSPAHRWRGRRGFGALAPVGLLLAGLALAPLAQAQPEPRPAAPSSAGAPRSQAAATAEVPAKGRAPDAGTRAKRSKAKPRVSPPVDAGAKLSATGSPTPAPLELSSVLAQLSKIEALRAHFVEDKRMALLAQPMRSQGTLYYGKPRLLARHTEQPRKVSLLLRDETLTFGDAQHSESIALSAQPSLRVLVDTFVSVLGGDLAALERVAVLSIEPLPDQGFRIRVTPKDEKVKRLVRAMSFEGQGALLSRMELLDANGDTTVTTFSQVELRAPFSAAERARIFRIGG
jgi:outer membrane lipoprotein-sorting protein